MMGSQHPSPTCASSLPLLDTETKRVCPTHSPTKGLKDAVTAAGAAVVVAVAVAAAVAVFVAVALAEVADAGAGATVTVTVVVSTAELPVAALPHAAVAEAKSVRTKITTGERLGMPGSLGTPRQPSSGPRSSLRAE